MDLEILEYGAPSQLGSKPMIVLFHGAASQASQWKKLITLMRENYHIFAFNQYGYGHSPHWSSEDRLTLFDQVKPVVSYIQSLGRPVHLVGHSHGSTLAVLTATNIPHLVASMSLYEPNTFGILDPTDAEDKFHYDRTYQAFDMTYMPQGILVEEHAEESAQQLFNFWLGIHAWKTMDPKVQQRLIDWMPATAREVYAVMHDTFSIHSLKIIADKILFMYDPHTAIEAVQVIKRYQSILPGSSSQTFENLGHLTPIHYANLVNPIIQKHIHLHTKS